MDTATFRQHFPEFADVSVFPDSQIEYWSGIGELMLRVEAWADLYDHGLELFTSHHLVLARKNQKAAAGGGEMGTNTGAMSSKSIDKVSASFDTGSSTLDDAGHWNLTTYGTQFKMLSDMVGSGGAIAWGEGRARAASLSQWFGGAPVWP